jgi:glycine/D-amino acid oxidase-like deaminating enzyme
MTSPKHDPYWWDAAPLLSFEAKPLAPTADVVIVGAGYTGLSAAITLARAGRSVLVFEKQRPGEGASSRNGGITSGNLRPSLAEMTKSFGEARAKAILAESKAAREDLYRFIAEEKIDCDFALTGRFAGAAAPGDYEGLARDAEYLNKAFGIEAHAVPRSEQRNVLGTDYYFGGNVRMDIGGLHPGKFLAEMLRLALSAGAVLHAETAILGVAQEGDGYEVATSRGTVRARDVIVGTNGYTDSSNRWLRRRLVALRSRIIATAPISPNLMGELMPRRMMVSDTRNLSYYYRPSPDGTRILFGGRDGTLTGTGEGPTRRLRETMVGLFPELSDTAITHSWYGYVAMNRDMVPRIFTREGMRYATGYCGSGVVWARWAGRKAALQVLGKDGSSALDFRPPAAVPLFNGTAWFMPAYMSWLTLQDRLKARQRPAE